MEKQLRRFKKDSVLGGVASGLARYFNIDVVIVRLLFVVSLFVSFGVSLFAYIILWVALPEEPLYHFGEPGTVVTETLPAEPVPAGSGLNSDRNLKIIAIGLIGLGAYMLLNQYIVWYQLSKFFWPLVMIGIGAFLLLRKRDQDYEFRNRDSYHQDTVSRFEGNDQPGDNAEKGNGEDMFKVN